MENAIYWLYKYTERTLGSRICIFTDAFLHGMHTLRKIIKSIGHQEWKFTPELLKLVSSLNKLSLLALIKLGHFLMPIPLFYCSLWFSLILTHLLVISSGLLVTDLGFFPVFCSLSLLLYIMFSPLIPLLITFGSFFVWLLYCTLRHCEKNNQKQMIWERACKCVNEHIYSEVNYVIVNIFSRVHLDWWSEERVFHLQHSHLSAAKACLLTPLLEHTSHRQNSTDGIFSLTGYKACF